jgi:pimeloyl-ACP methyl ester carboxylesterase
LILAQEIPMTTTSRRQVTTASLGLALAGITLSGAADAQTTPSTGETAANPWSTRYRTADIDGLKVFYREAGPADAPTVLLLHGFPTSSHMFRDLIPALADRYHVVAPDYPGFGHSDFPDRAQFPYGFAAYAEVIDKFTQVIGLERYTIYIQDYGAPVGLRLAVRAPERIAGIIIQNGNAYEEGLKEFWKPIKAYWASGQPAQREALRAGTTLEATRSQYLDGAADRSRVDPSAWVQDQALLDRPGNVEIQLDLFYDYRTNLELYPQFQKFFRERQPPTLIVWGRNDVIFPAEGARAYLKDLPRAELHLLDTGHFALEEQGDEIARLMRDFLARTFVQDARSLRNAPLPYAQHSSVR